MPFHPEKKRKAGDNAIYETIIINFIRKTSPNERNH